MVTEKQDQDVVAEETDTGSTGGSPSTSQAIPPKEKTKSFLAKIFILSFLFIVGLIPLALVWSGKININDYKDIVLTLASILGGPLGIVISGYFKDGSDQ
jgi:preprotein translocase subunit SecG